MTDEELLRQALSWSDGGRGVALATVVRTWGSALRPAGSLMAMSDGGDVLGSVSGGCVESAVAHEAMSLLRGGTPRLLRYGVTDERAWEVGLACGGTLEVLVEDLAPRRALLAGLLDALAAKRTAVVVTRLGTAEALLVDPEAPDAGMEPALADAARDAARRDRTLVVEAAGGPALVRPFNAPVRVVIVGAVHVAQPLARMVQLAGYDVVVIDPRRTYATEERFAGIPLVRAWPDEAFARLALDRRTAVVALTHDPKIDDPALAAALRSSAFYVGALGSRKTQADRRERLRELGFGETDLARIHGPVGPPIGAVTPGEIATSILAELVAALRK